MTSSSRKVCFVSGTRADFGKLTSLIRVLEESPIFEPSIFVTGMHLDPDFGDTWRQVKATHSCIITMRPNHETGRSMDRIFSATVSAFSDYLESNNPALIVVHGDRVEALACAAVGAMAGLRVAHIEGGERSGTIDETFRHAITKLAHAHFVSNDDAHSYIEKLGERSGTIYTIGSPDLDVLLSSALPSFEEVRNHYNIPFAGGTYGICIFHPVFYEQDQIAGHAEALVAAILESEKNFIVIGPNNDPGYTHILDAYEAFSNCNKVRFFSSIRFEFFGTLLSGARMMIGNSSAALFEAPAMGVRAVNIGTRQANRLSPESVVDILPNKGEILDAINSTWDLPAPNTSSIRGSGKAAEDFLAVVSQQAFWDVPLDKSLGACR